MSLFDILKNADFGSALDTLARQARGAANNFQKQAPGGLGGLLGAGALGAVLGNIMSSDVVKGVAVAGAGAVAWNFYKKWAAQQQAGQQNNTNDSMQGMPAGFGPDTATAPITGVDPTAELVMRAMIYAAKADGNMDAVEKQRIDTVLAGMLPGKNVEHVIQTISAETIDPNKIAAEVTSPEQAQDVYRLSCITIDPDQFMEKNYLQALANALHIDNATKNDLENEAQMARQQLATALPA